MALVVDFITLSLVVLTLYSGLLNRSGFWKKNILFLNNISFVLTSMYTQTEKIKVYLEVEFKKEV